MTPPGKVLNPKSLNKNPAALALACVACAYKANAAEMFPSPRPGVVLAGHQYMAGPGLQVS